MLHSNHFSKLLLYSTYTYDLYYYKLQYYNYNTLYCNIYYIIIFHYHLPGTKNNNNAKNFYEKIHVSDINRKK